ncbi:unnamed protein product [Mycena citricolor]|uniref:Uncharacterized protein n=1 Tax=Mycena citricolor TaxID=2018698 RepID=A0AAD2JY35_9AGAR|nr:unnamed protein product [Mycena citricolor]
MILPSESDKPQTIYPNELNDTMPLGDTDAPPAYEVSQIATASTFPTDSKRPPPLGATSSTLPIPIASSSRLSPVSSSWFGFTSPTVRQVRSTVLGLVKDLVKLPHEDRSSVGISILKSCADACSANGLSISSVLQEKSVEGHTPIYWAVVKRPSDVESDQLQGTDLLSALISLASPLTPATISDVRLACLLNSDQLLFQRLRSSPEFSPLSATDEMILDATVPHDDITVENVAPTETDGAGSGAFVVDFAVPHFQKRMLLGKSIVLEFIARSRMWRLAFYVSPHENRRPGMPPSGTWYVTLGLLEHSPPSWIDSRLLIPPPSEPDGPIGTPARGIFGAGKSRPRPTLSMRLKANDQLKPHPRGHLRSYIVVLLDGSDNDGGLGGFNMRDVRIYIRMRHCDFALKRD